jgi:hypothetical protein
MAGTHLRLLLTDEGHGFSRAVEFLHILGSSE